MKPGSPWGFILEDGEQKQVVVPLLTVWGFLMGLRGLHLQ